MMKGKFSRPKGWAVNHFKSESHCDCMESSGRCELQFGLINDSLAVGDRSLAVLPKKIRQLAIVLYHTFYHNEKILSNVEQCI